MAYINVEKGYQTPNQSDLPWTQTFRMTLRAPAVANRIFDTYAHAQAYIDDYSAKASATPGILLVVVSDSNSDYNGVWEVLTVKTSQSDAAGTMRRIDERSVVEVSNNTTDLEKFITPGIYFIKNTTTNKGYTLFVEVTEEQSIIQSLVDQNGYQYRTGTAATVEGQTVITWTTWVSKNYSFAEHTHTTDDITVAGTQETLTAKLSSMQLLIYAGLA